VHAAADFENCFEPSEMDLLQTTVWRVATRKRNGKLNIKEYLMLNSTDGRTTGCTPDKKYAYGLVCRGRVMLPSTHVG
jgi:hypothetical protein